MTPSSHRKLLHRCPSSVARHWFISLRTADLATQALVERVEALVGLAAKSARVVADLDECGAGRRRDLLEYGDPGIGGLSHHADPAPPIRMSCETTVKPRFVISSRSWRAQSGHHQPAQSTGRRRSAGGTLTST